MAVSMTAARWICAACPASQARPSVCSMITLLERKRVTPTHSSISALVACCCKCRLPISCGWLSVNQSIEATQGRMHPLITSC